MLNRYHIHSTVDIDITAKVSTTLFSRCLFGAKMEFRLRHFCTKFWWIVLSKKFSMIYLEWYEPASISNTRQCGTSDNLDATTEPPEPPPITMKSYSLSGTDRVYSGTWLKVWHFQQRNLLLFISLTLGRLHGSSKSHCERKNTSSKPINNINWPPPQVDAKVGPIGDPTGQSHKAIVWKKNSKTNWLPNLETSIRLEIFKIAIKTWSEEVLDNIRLK